MPGPQPSPGDSLDLRPVSSHRALSPPQNEWNAYYEEVVYVLEEIEYVIKKLPEWAADEPVEKTPQTQQDECYIHSEPLGVVLIIGIWNYPFTVTIQPMVGAIAAGTWAPFQEGVARDHCPTPAECGQRSGGELRPGGRWSPGVRSWSDGHRMDGAPAWSLGGQDSDSVCSAGNAVVTKPSELSENMANLLATIIPQYLDRVRCSPGLWGLRNSAFLQQDAKPWVGPRTAGLSHGGEWSPGVRRGGLFDGGWLARVRRGRGLSRASSLSSRGRTCTR